jgi:hypothetical protein
MVGGASRTCGQEKDMLESGTSKGEFAPLADAQLTQSSASEQGPVTSGWMGLVRSLRDMSVGAWRAAPTYDQNLLSWRRVLTAAVRTACCGAVLWAVLIRFQPSPHVDLYPTYVAARLANEGRWEHIYHRSIWLHGNVDPEWDRRAESLVKGGLHGTSFVYHPWYLSVVRPIAARVDYQTFQQGMLTVCKGSIVLVGLCLAMLLGWRSLPEQLFLTLIVGVAPVTLYGIELGQNVLPALAMSLAAVVAWQSRLGLVVGGVFASLAWICKPWCAALLPLCFVLRGFRGGLVTSVVMVLGLLVLPEFVMPHVLMNDYRAMNLGLSKVSIAAWNNLSVLSIVERFAYPDWAQHLGVFVPSRPLPLHQVAALTVTAVLCLLAGLIWYHRRPSPQWTSAAWLSFMLMPLGICWTHYFVFGLPLACVTAFSSRAPIGLRAAGVCLLVLLVGIETFNEVSAAEHLAYMTQPGGVPWLRMLPMALMGCVMLGALWFERDHRAQNCATVP